MNRITNIIPDNTTVKILVNGTYIYGTVQGNDEENSEENLENLNYYVVPTGKIFNDEIMVLWSEIELVADCFKCGEHFEQKVDIYEDTEEIYVICPICKGNFNI